jgi:peptidoglycan hydrolase-like protein with peptidoglycan-binding domain
MMAKHRRASQSRRGVSVSIAAAVALAVVAGIAVLTDRYGAGSAGTQRAAAATGAVTAPPSSPSKPAQPAASDVVVRPATVVSISTSSGASGADPIVVTYDAPTTAASPLPQVDPQTEGSWWQPTPATWRFTPTVPFVPDTTVTVTAGTKQFTYKVADGSLLRAQQILADLHYLPLTFAPATAIANTAAGQGALAFAPPAGDFAMRYGSTPAELSALWAPGKMTAVTKGAIMAFENVHHLAIDGVAGPAVWAALLHDAVAGAVDPQPYTWAWTTMKRPETLRIWSDGDFVFSSKANTGISAAETPIGSWPVFSRFRTQTMKGTNPDGTKYNDPGVPFISYFYQGDAIHGFKRASYGSPQSLGCVELPYDAAQTVWNLIDYGTVVTVTHA